MAKDVEFPLWMNPEKVESLTNGLVAAILEQASNPSEAFTVAFAVLCRFAQNVDPKHREVLRERLMLALKVFWKSQDEQKSPVM